MQDLYAKSKIFRISKWDTSLNLAVIVVPVDVWPFGMVLAFHILEE